MSTLLENLILLTLKLLFLLQVLLFQQLDQLLIVVIKSQLNGDYRSKIEGVEC